MDSNSFNNGSKIYDLNNKMHKYLGEECVEPRELGFDDIKFTDNLSSKLKNIISKNFENLESILINLFSNRIKDQKQLSKAISSIKAKLNPIIDKNINRYELFFHNNLKIPKNNYKNFKPTILDISHNKHSNLDNSLNEERLEEIILKIKEQLSLYKKNKKEYLMNKYLEDYKQNQRNKFQLDSNSNNLNEDMKLLKLGNEEFFNDINIILSKIENKQNKIITDLAYR